MSRLDPKNDFVLEQLLTRERALLGDMLEGVLGRDVGVPTVLMQTSLATGRMTRGSRSPFAPSSPTARSGSRQRHHRPCRRGQAERRGRGEACIVVQFSWGQHCKRSPDCGHHCPGASAFPPTRHRKRLSPYGSSTKRMPVLPIVGRGPAAVGTHLRLQTRTLRSALFELQIPRIAFESRDFAALDPEQERIAGELALDNIAYVYRLS